MSAPLSAYCLLLLKRSGYISYRFPGIDEGNRGVDFLKRLRSPGVCAGIWPTFVSRLSYMIASRSFVNLNSTFFNLALMSSRMPVKFSALAPKFLSMFSLILTYSGVGPDPSLDPLRHNEALAFPTSFSNSI